MNIDQNNNARGLGEEIAKVLAEELEGLLKGASEDLQIAATRISTNAIAAASTGRQDLVDECRAQARVLLEENRLRSIGGSWTAVEAVIGAVIRTLAITASGSAA